MNLTILKQRHLQEAATEATRLFGTVEDNTSGDDQQAAVVKKAEATLRHALAEIDLIEDAFSPL